MISDFEVLISEAKGKGYYSARLNKYIFETHRKWIHIQGVRSHDQAVALARKKGHRVLGVRKFDHTRQLADIEKLQLNQKEPNKTAIEIDELVVNRQKRKLDNKWKDKEGLWA